MTRPVVPLLLALALGGQQPRDVQRAAAGTLELGGIVVSDDGSNTPVRGADVRINVGADPRTMRSTATDSAGRFRFTGLAPGNFTLIALKPGYVTTTYGAKRPGSTVGVPIALVAGRAGEPVTVRMPRGAVITGRILDRAGRPVRNVPVRVERVVADRRGDPTVTPFNSGTAASRSSDDRGIYRIFGLPAGDYLVSVQPRMPGPLLAAAEDVRLTTPDELQWAERAIAAGPGGVAPATAAAAAQIAAPPRASTVTFASVFHPGTADPSRAAVVSLGAGQERGGIDIPVQLVPTATIAGVVRDANGLPPKDVSVALLPKRSGASLEVERELVLFDVGLVAGRGSARISADGTFTIRAVPPGDYAVIARTGIRPVTPAAVAIPGPPAQFASVDVTIDGRDVEGLALTLEDALKVEGRVTFDSGSGATPPRATLRLTAVETAGSTGTAVTIDASSQTFSIGGVLPGEYRLSATVNPPSRATWTAASAMLDGRDVFDIPFTVAPGRNVNGIAVTFTDAAAELAGTLYDSAGRPTADLSIMLLSVDPARWFRGSRYVRVPIRPSTDGRFTLTGLAPGDYVLAALAEFEPGDLLDSVFLEQVAAGGIRVSVAAGAKQTQDVRIR